MISTAHLYRCQDYKLNVSERETTTTEDKEKRWSNKELQKQKKKFNKEVNDVSSAANILRIIFKKDMTGWSKHTLCVIWKDHFEDTGVD